MNIPLSFHRRWLAISTLALSLYLVGFTNTPARAADRRAIPNTSCNPLPAINPNRGFLGNFNNACYAISLIVGGGGSSLGDLNAAYDQIFYQIAAGYELVVLGTYPNARFMSATAYDDHLAVVATLTDQQILPTISSMVNPFLAGNTYTPNQTYGFTVSFGGGPVATMAPGCSTSSTTIDQNVLDASQIHQGLTWTGYPGLPGNFPPHETGANAAGVIYVRKYVLAAPSATEVAIVRRLSDGCAISAQQAIQLNILGPAQRYPSPWLHQEQINAHQEFSTQIEPTWCYPTDPVNYAFWLRTRDYAPFDNAAAAGIQATIQSVRVQNMVSGLTFMRVRFKAPTAPNTPCTTGNCSLTGNEQLRYYSLSLQSGLSTLLSMKDSDFVLDPNGNVTVLFSLGAVPPSWVTPENYYTYVDLTKVPNAQTMVSLLLRNMLPNASFACSTFNVPFLTMEYNPEGGFMGQNVPTVDYPLPTQLPAPPVPPTRTDSCLLAPPPPVACGT